MDAPPDSPLTREIFGNLSGWSQALFYFFALVAVVVFVAGVRRRMRLWKVGRPVPDPPGWKRAAANLWRYALLQQRVRGRGRASLAHRLLFGGFLVLFIGTLLIAVEHVAAMILARGPRDAVFHKGIYFAVYEIVLDTAGLALLAGCALFAVRRWNRPRALAHDYGDWLVLALFAAIGLTGYVVEGLRIIREQTPLPGVSYVGFATSSVWNSLGVTPASAAGWHAAGWWLHAVLSLTLIAVFPWSRLLHSIAGAVRLAAGIDRPGTLALVSLEEVEETGRLGAAHFADFTRRQLVELDACVSCGRCEEACPAFEAGKPLSPRNVVQDLRRHLDSAAPRATNRADDAAPDDAPAIPGTIIAEETIWACTTCSACVDVCPLGVNPLGFITDMRRHLVAEAQLRGPPAVALQRSDRSGNPWGMPAADRLAWADGLDVPTVEKNPGFDVLYWVGCAATYDRRLQRVARSVVKLLRAAGVNFAVLGPRERCTGEAARRMGDELLFQKLAGENTATFEQCGAAAGAKQIVAHCPHCVNSLRQDYSQLGALLNVVHHTEFLADLVQSGRLKVAPDGVPSSKTTYHDPCYLARAQGITDEPRILLERAQGASSLVEMPRHGRQTACCGAGGGRMWFDDAPATRTGQSRVAEARATGARTLAVSCPFCLIMTTDGLAARDSQMEVRDVAEILAERIDSSGSTP